MRRALAAALALSFLAGGGCGGEPKYRSRTAREWAGYLWDADPKVVAAALDNLVAFADKSPGPVFEALETALERPPTPASAAPFSYTVDLATAEALGLEPIPVNDAASTSLAVVRARVKALGIRAGTFKSLPDGSLDVVLEGNRSRAEVERLQRVLGTRGAFDLRVLVPDPAKGPVPGARRSVVYEDGTPFGERLAAEAARERAARGEGRRYVPADPRWRAVPREGGDGHVLVEEPAGEADALDDRLTLSAEARSEAKGRLVVSLEIREERREAWRAFATRNAGLSMGVIVDGFLVGTTTVPAAPGRSVVLALWPEAGPAERERAVDLAVVLGAGRLPWPVAPIPIPAGFGRDPAPDNPVAKTLVALGERAVPALERVVAKAPAAWSRESAKWALDQIRGRVGPSDGR